MSPQLARPASPVVVVTGADDPLGLEVCKQLTGAGAQVIMGARSSIAGAEAARLVRRCVAGAVCSVEPLDLGDLASVRAFAETLRATATPVDGLVHAASFGISPVKIISPDGFEGHLAVNFLGPYALSAALLPALIATRTPRIVHVTSAAARVVPLGLEDLAPTDRYEPLGAYLQSRLAALSTSLHLAKVSERRNWNVQSVAVHAGNLHGQRSWSGGSVMMSAAGLISRALPHNALEDGARCVTHAALGHVRSGRCYGPGGRGQLTGGAPLEVPIPRSARDYVLAAHLWQYARRETASVFPPALDGCLTAA